MNESNIPGGIPPEVVTASSEAVHAAKNAAQAVELSRLASMDALQQSTADAVIRGFKEVFGEVPDTGRFVDTNKIKFICKDIEGINTKMGEMTEAMTKLEEKFEEHYVNQDQFAPVKIIAYGLVGTTMLGVLGAILMLVIRQ